MESEQRADGKAKGLVIQQPVYHEKQFYREDPGQSQQGSKEGGNGI